MADKQKQPKVQFVTPVGVAAYAYFHAPDTGKQYSNNKYKGDLLLDGDTDLSKFEQICRDFLLAVYPNADMSDIGLPFRSGEDHKNEEFRDKIIFKASSKFAPQVVDAKKATLKGKLQARSGDRVRYVVTLFAYETTEVVKENGKKKTVTTWGVSAQLQVVQLIEKRAGGGGLDQLGEIDGFDSSEEGGDWGDAGGNDDADDNGGDF